jgi:hypothetical protein
MELLRVFRTYNESDEQEMPIAIRFEKNRTGNRCAGTQRLEDRSLTWEMFPEAEKIQSSTKDR